MVMNYLQDISSKLSDTTDRLKQLDEKVFNLDSKVTMMTEQAKTTEGRVAKLEAHPGDVKVNNCIWSKRSLKNPRKIQR